MLKSDDYEQWSQTSSDNGSFNVIPGSVSMTLRDYGYVVCQEKAKGKTSKYVGYLMNAPVWLVCRDCLSTAWIG